MLVKETMGIMWDEVKVFVPPILRTGVFFSAVVLIIYSTLIVLENVYPGLQFEWRVIIALMVQFIISLGYLWARRCYEEAENMLEQREREKMHE